MEEGQRNSWSFCAYYISGKHSTVDNTILVILLCMGLILMLKDRYFWNELRQIKVMNVEVWVEVGDFNVTKEASERVNLVIIEIWMNWDLFLNWN